MRAALIRDGKVFNLIALHAGWNDPASGSRYYVPPQGCTVVELADDQMVSLGWLYQDGAFVEVDTRPVPAFVTPLQMRKALRASGLTESVQAYLAQAPDETVEAWEYATQVDRNNEMIEAAAAALGMTEAQRDDLFRLAATFNS